jgi:hypothetical protein
MLQLLKTRGAFEAIPKAFVQQTFKQFEQSMKYTHYLRHF